MISGKELGDSWQCMTAVILTHIWTNNLHVVVVVLLLVWICLFSGWRENEDQEAEFTTRARGSAIHAPLCQKYHWRVQKGKTLQAYPFYVVGVFSPSNSPDQKSSSGLFSTQLSSLLSVVASFFLISSLSPFLDSLAPPSELLELCELSLEKMGAIFADTNVYMLHMMYQAMGVCLYMQDWDGAMSYGEKIVQPYRWTDLQLL